MINFADTPMQSLSVKQKSYYFALFSEYAYLDPVNGQFKFNELGFTTDFVSVKNSDCYLLKTDYDFIIVCRGTQPSQYADIKADINVSLTHTEYSDIVKVHQGFKNHVDEVWPYLVIQLVNHGYTRNIWCTGHSLGAAMSTLISYYMCKEHIIPVPRAVFTYGCPKVGNDTFVEELQGYKIPHYRFVNNADIVPRLPFRPYHHINNMYYMNHWGNIRSYNTWQIIKDCVRGFIKGLKEGEINYFTNHDIKRYKNNLSRWAKGIERPQDTI